MAVSSTASAPPPTESFLAAVGIIGRDDGGRGVGRWEVVDRVRAKLDISLADAESALSAWTLRCGGSAPH